MDIIELGALGEFFSAIAVVVTLVYLALQVRHSREALNANTSELEQSRRLQMAEAGRRAFNTRGVEE